MTPFSGRLRARHLEVILSVADLGNLTRAAEQLDMTQSGLSRAVAEVEEIVGGRLFLRSARGMVMTSLGAAMHRHAAVILGDMHRAQADLASLANGGAGSLTVGCFSMFVRWPLAQAILDFRETNPLVQISVDVGAHESLIEKLDNGAIDLLVSRNSRAWHGGAYRAVELMNDGIVLACSPAHPLARRRATLEDCVRFPWVSAPAGSIMRARLADEIRTAQLDVPHIVGALSLELGRELVMSGPYLWHLPGSVARNMAARNEIVILPVTFKMDPGPLCAIWRRERSSTRMSRSFMLALRAAVQVARPHPDTA